MPIAKSSAAEHRRLLALRAPFAFTEARLMLQHLQALGVDCGDLPADLERAQYALMALATDALAGHAADTPEQEAGRS